MVAMKRIGNETPVLGLLTEATPAGFERVVQQANEVHARGYLLAGVVQVSGGQLGAVYVRTRPVASVANPLLDE